MIFASDCTANLISNVHRNSNKTVMLVAVLNYVTLIGLKGNAVESGNIFILKKILPQFLNFFFIKFFFFKFTTLF